MNHASPGKTPWALTFEGTGTLLFLMVVLAFGCLMPVQNDTWWHLRVGQDIVRTGSVPLADYLSHSAAGRFWPNHEWLAQVVFYLVYRLGGLPGLALLAAGIMTSAWAVLASVMEPRSRLLALALTMPLSAAGWAIRPHLFTFLFLALTLRLLVQRRERWLVLILPLWANFHSGVVIAGPILGAAAVLTWLRDRPRFPRLLGLWLVWGLASMATPLGPRLFEFVVTNLGSPAARHLQEWQPPRPGELISALFFADVALLLGLLVWRWRTRSWSRHWAYELPVAVSLLFVPLGLRAVRHISLAVMMAGPALSRLLPTRGSRATESSPERPGVNVGLTLVGLLGAVILVGQSWSHPRPRMGWQPMSAAAANAIASCPDPIYNHYDDGGFILWFVQSKRVFLDSRHDPYPQEMMLAQFHAQRTGDANALFQRFGFRCAVVRPSDRMATSLRGRGWTPVHRDQRWLVLIEPTAQRPSSH